MLPPVFQTLKASPDVLAFVGTNPPRIWSHGEAPQQKENAPTLAFVVWQLIVGTPENNLSDPPPCDRMTVQVDAYHQTAKGVDDMATAVRDALEPVAYMTGIIVDSRESETRLFRMGMQFDFFHGR